MELGGTELFGRIDRVPGLFHVATRCTHVALLPLVPRDSWLVLEADDDDLPEARRRQIRRAPQRGLPMSVNRTSYVHAWLRAIAGHAAFWLLIVGIAAAVHAAAERAASDWDVAFLLAGAVLLLASSLAELLRTVRGPLLVIAVVVGLVALEAIDLSFVHPVPWIGGGLVALGVLALSARASRVSYARAVELGRALGLPAARVQARLDELGVRGSPLPAARLRRAYGTRTSADANAARAARRSALPDEPTGSSSTAQNAKARGSL